MGQLIILKIELYYRAKALQVQGDADDDTFYMTLNKQKLMLTRLLEAMNFQIFTKA